MLSSERRCRLPCQARGGRRQGHCKPVSGHCKSVSGSAGACNSAGTPFLPFCIDTSDMTTFLMPVLHCCRAKMLLHQRKDSWQSGSSVWMIGSRDCSILYTLSNGHEQSQPHSVSIDRCASTSLSIGVLDSDPSLSIWLELRSAATPQYGEKPGKYVLGVLVTIVDDVASDFVYGPLGTSCRPQGLMTISMIDKLHSAKLLSSVCKERWLAFLQIWQNAGWSPTGLVDFVTALRPLQYRNDLDEDFICSVT